MGNPIQIVYSYNFKNGSTKKFDVLLDRQTLAFIPGKRLDPPLWALLNHKKCAPCPLDVASHAYCPIALNFADIAEQFKDMASHEEVNVTVITAEWNLDGLAKVYAEVGVVNRDFAQRLRDAAKKDANVNALVNLDCFATMVPLAAEETLSGIKPYFSAYL